MQRLLKITIVLALLYAGYWAVGSAVMQTGVQRALDQAQSDGQLRYGSFSLRGFPSRFDITVEDITVTAPDRQTRWSAPFIQVFALAYRPNRIIAVWPNDQRLEVLSQTINATTQDMRASVSFGASTALPLRDARLVAQEIGLTSDADWRLEMSEARFATRAVDEQDTAHDLGVEVLNIRPSPGLKLLIDPEGSLPGSAERLRIDATLGFDRPLDRFALQTEPPQLTGLALREFSLRWGDLEVAASGELTITETRRPEGRITVRAEKWREMLRIATAAGLLNPDTAPTVERALGQLALLSGEPETLELPLVFSRGRISLGPVPLGFAPQF